MRVECLGEARSVRRVSIAEVLEVDDATAHSVGQYIVEQLQAVSTRDVYLSPPALLFGPGCVLEARVLLPRAAAPGAPEAPPKLRVVEVVPA